jgi:hypothetical protein
LTHTVEAVALDTIVAFVIPLVTLLTSSSVMCKNAFGILVYCQSCLGESLKKFLCFEVAASVDVAYFEGSSHAAFIL